jgi:hypothetical protein
MSFFNTEELYTVMPAKGADKGGRAASEAWSRSPLMAVSGGDGRPPGSSEESQLNASAQFGIKKDIPIPVTTGFQS